MPNKGTIKKGEVRNPYGRKGRPKTNQSQLVSRRNLAGLAGQHFGGDRDLYKTMGYPRHLTPEDYTDVYLRQDIAGRICDAYPDATWRESPEIIADQSFVEAIKALDRRFQLWRSFHRLDRLTQLGHYGVLLMGLDGGENPAIPAQGNNYNLLYLQPHSERTAQITQWEDNPQNPRYGMPKLYRITTGVNWTGSGAGQRTINVHHSRVIHVAERALEDSSIGTPRLERIYNRLMDMDKLLGGSAEMYWQNVAMLMAFIADKDTEFDEDQRGDMADQLEEMQNGLRRMLRLRGMTAENLAPGLQGSDPGTHLEWQMKIIAGSEGIPLRILLGNEAGELASSQDETAWAGRVDERREQFASPGIIEPFITQAQKLGILPKAQFEIEWPEADTLGPAKRAEIADRKASALQKYNSTPGAELLVSPDEFRAWLGEEAPIDSQPDDDLDEDDGEVVTQFRRIK